MHSPLRFLVRVPAIVLNETFNFRSFNSSISCILGVYFSGLTHLGIMGTAPSARILNIWNEREKKLSETSHESLKLCEVFFSRGPLLTYQPLEIAYLERLKKALLSGKRLQMKSQELFLE